MEGISDHLKENLDILFVGFNPSIRSGETGHHYANPNNRFWKILFESGLTPRKYEPTEDSSLLDLGYGFTNIVSRPTIGADDITKEEYIKGRKQLKRKIKKYKPKLVCFVGKGVYQEYRQLRKISWGLQEETTSNETMEFVAPSSSGLVRMPINEIIEIYSELPILLRKLKSN
ncbi:DNA glycosylase [Bacillus sp. Soil745]|uniref:mismatch-specific DNA-glycosylase n=1 Tax=Peribacillus frigoritolerans TaxID=450367 RepID=UPI00070FDD3C|nr:mismatch-specific DNA-glycosylase [Peribacillus frigoritolerans]KRF51799.1 DNA glycosylase [Bacillus sp. Soil745]MED3712270.1 mismatch-specific DNA-glycosylase [Peribacillus frigoritolerans]MED3890386.1 mismatch-specific DNA-glycosylase [Peribacillus frigoritolerans]PAW27352.1 mismatch-specific DNA-glycosylase [Peribacillus simplex]